MAGKKSKSGKRKASGEGAAKPAVSPANIDLALQFHKQGDFDGAQSLYQKILEQQPDHGRCLYFLGLLLSQRGALQQAAGYMARGLAIDPSSPSGHNNLGTVYQRLNQPANAEKSFLAAIERDGGLLEAHINLGSIYQAEGRPAEAEACFIRALKINPDSAEACVNLGAVRRLTGQLKDAEMILRHAVQCAPGLASAHNHLGIVLHEQERLQDAFMAFKAALEIDPGFIDAYNNMGSVFRDQNQTDAALACYNKALSLDDNCADAHNNIGAVLQSLGRLDEAELHFRRANDLRPDFPPALMNLGTVLHKSGRHGEARDLYERAIAVDAQYPQAHFGLAELILYMGEDLKPGWLEHFWRWKKPELRDQWRHFDCPMWRGEELDDKSIVVWGEQGIGEEILYATMIPDLIERGARVIVECENRLLPLFARAFPGATCLARDDASDWSETADYHCAAADLGAWLRPDMPSFPERGPLLQADPARRDALRHAYKAGGDGPLIGISWFSRNPEMGWEKSIDLQAWAPFLKSAGPATFVDLQYGDTGSQREVFEAVTGIGLIHDDSIDQMRDLEGFAAQIAALDLVISISNTTVHMAGALGVPTWCLLSSAPLWRWFKDREDCPWYPSVRFFRQGARGNWDAVIARVGAALAQRFG
ncbi:MAG: tetratricopeptide repeat protein [Rhodospirillales bacterium]|nr:tetratricopeptide repeat protein [Rhodospirillales bacterium]